MPFSSKAEQRFMFEKHPKIAKEFAKHTDFEKLPEKAKKAKRQMDALKEMVKKKK